MGTRSKIRALGLFDALCFAAILAILAIPALAAVVLPIPGTYYVIDVGEVPAWIMAMGVIVNTWMLVSVHRKTIKIEKQTDGVLNHVAAMSKVEGKTEERAEVAAAKVIVRSDAVADAKAAAEVRAVETNPSPPNPST